MTCRQCGMELPDGVAFCTNCGASCKETPQEPAISPEPEELIPEIQIPIPAPEEAPAEPVDVIPEPEEAAEPIAEVEALIEPAAETQEPCEEPAAEPEEILPELHTCPTCGMELPENTIFCPGCGCNICAPGQKYIPSQIPVSQMPASQPEPQPEPEPEHRCANCNALLTDDQLFCPKCGTPVQPVAPAQSKFCTKCGAPAKDDQLFCSKCGTPTAKPATKRCGACGTEVPQDKRFCTKCGTPFTGAVGITPPVYTPAPRPTPAPTPAPIPTPAPVKPKKKRFEPNLAARIILRLLSVLLCLCLTASLLMTIVVLDLRQITNKNNLQNIISSNLTLRGPLSAAVDSQSQQITTDTADSLLQWVYDMLMEESAELDFTQEQMEEFFERSTAKDFLAEKTASYFADFINGTNDTTISRREIAQIINENADLIEDVFGEPVDATLREEILDMVEEADIDRIIREEVIATARNTQIVTGAGSYTVEDLMEDLTQFTSDSTLWALICINLLIVLMLLITNWFRFGSTLICASVPTLILGVLLVIPTALLQLVPNLLTDSIGGMIAGIVGALVSLIAPVHYIALAAGILLLIIGCVIKSLSKK